MASTPYSTIKTHFMRSKIKKNPSFAAPFPFFFSSDKCFLLFGFFDHICLSTLFLQTPKFVEELKNAMLLYTSFILLLHNFYYMGYFTFAVFH